jgi:SAM-dependent methyltransferase
VNRPSSGGSPAVRSADDKPQREGSFATGPRAWLRKLWRALRGRGSPARVGVSVGLGLFIGCLPLYGLHLPLCVAVCMPFGLDAVLAYVAANISNPVLAPLLVVSEVELGSLLTKGRWVTFDLEAARRIGAAGFALQLGLGSIVLGGVLGVLGGFAAAMVARKQQSEPSQALRRTRARYRAAPIGDRCYVAFKLWLDPVIAQLKAEGPLGDVLDIGCGRGQIGLCLLELGHTRTLTGFDFDARKIDLAQRAAGEEAVFRLGSAVDAALEPADTVLLIDVLHYLAPEEQERVLECAVRAVRPGGRLIIREAEAGSGVRARLTRALERIGTFLGYNRAASTLGFRSSGSLAERLSKLGCSVHLNPRSTFSLLANTFIVARPSRSDSE